MFTLGWLLNFEVKVCPVFRATLKDSRRLERAAWHSQQYQPARESICFSSSENSIAKSFSFGVILFRVRSRVYGWPDFFGPARFRFSSGVEKFMSVIRHTFSILVSVILLAGSVAAQSAGRAQERPATRSVVSVVTAAASGAGARFVSPEGARRMRLEVYTAAGERLFDSDFHAGSILDWDGQGLSDGSYLCVVTVEDLQGGLSRRLSAVTLRGGSASVRTDGEEQLKAEYAQALAASGQSQGPAGQSQDGDAAAASVSQKGKAGAVTVAAHDGQDGQVTSTSGALTFRTGDVFSGREHEQMRVTPEGRVGIGTDKPEATLDVAGSIRARGGIVFDDGTVLNSARVSAVRASNAASADTGTANVAGTGTSGALVKWTDNAGTLGDSAISESSGNVGIGTASPNSKLHVVGRLELGSPTAGPGINPTLFNANTVAGFAQFQFYPSGGTNTNMSFAVIPRGTGANLNRAQFSVFGTDYLADSNNYEFASLRARGTDFVFGTGGVGTGQSRPLMLAAGLLRDNTTNDGQLFLNTDGRVGVGTKTPQAKLDVTGDLRIGGAGNGLIFPDGSKMTTAGGSGGSMTGTSIVSVINDPATVGTIADARLSGNVARLNGANTWAGTQVFSAGLSAGGAQIVGVGNPVAGTDAANKAYVDATTVRLTPAAPQVSVGDANGTAAMLNLRGGSTCCSGPGGFTPGDFKVFQNGSFLATGNLGIGTIPVEGQGYRTMWYTYKGAFRSGYAANEWDDANTGFFSWAGGSQSTASGLYSFAFGDTNFATSTSSIVFGSGNEVKGAAGFSAGAGNRVCDTYGVAFGNKAQSGGPLINGKCDPDSFNITGLAAVAIGYNVTADKDHTTALGKFASNNSFSGTFVWSDGSATASADTFKNTANNEFAARATGGFRFRTNLTGTTGCNLPAGSGVFNCTSSRYTKENFNSVSGDDVLARLRKVPVSTWNYISEGQQVRHLGPMAEDFYQAFNLGVGNTSIGVQDAVGVSLAAVKALDERTAELQKKTEEVEQLRTKLSTLEQRLAALEQAVQSNAKQSEGQQK
jgi:hypothetical protein